MSHHSQSGNVNRRLKRTSMTKMHNTVPRKIVALHDMPSLKLDQLPSHVLTQILNELSPYDKLQNLALVNWSVHRLVFEKSSWKAVRSVHFRLFLASTKCDSNSMIVVRDQAHSAESLAQMDKVSQLLTNLRSVTINTHINLKSTAQLISELVHRHSVSIECIDVSSSVFEWNKSPGRIWIQLIQWILQHAKHIQMQQLLIAGLAHEEKHLELYRLYAQLPVKELRLVLSEQHDLVDSFEQIGKNVKESLHIEQIKDADNTVNLLNNLIPNTLRKLSICSRKAELDYLRIFEEVRHEQLLAVRELDLHFGFALNKISLPILTKILFRCPELAALRCVRDTIGCVDVQTCLEIIVLLWTLKKSKFELNLHLKLPEPGQPSVQMMFSQLHERLKGMDTQTNDVLRVQSNCVIENGSHCTDTVSIKQGPSQLVCKLHTFLGFGAVEDEEDKEETYEVSESDSGDESEETDEESDSDFDNELDEEEEEDAEGQVDCNIQ